MAQHWNKRPQRLPTPHPQKGRNTLARSRTPPGGNVRLARALSKLGFCSRSEAYDIIRAGRVQVRGKVERNPDFALDLDLARIQVDGMEIVPHKKVYLMLNKPRGLVTTRQDEQGRGTVYDCLPKGLPWLSPVGRLDKASEGLLLFTNDTQWAARVTLPETHLDKLYHVQVNCVADDSLARRMEQGISGEESGLLVAKNVSVLRHGEKNSWLVVVLNEGKNRHIRRLLNAQGIGVLRLIRIAIGSLQLGELPKGAWRYLNTAEIRALGGVSSAGDFPA
jgi:23S rRNA pseudouridine2605 synthase